MARALYWNSVRGPLRFSKPFDAPMGMVETTFVSDMCVEIGPELRPWNGLNLHHFVFNAMENDYKTGTRVEG